MTGSSRDTQYMALALRLAARARGATSPNPMVGAVVVAGGRIVGTGYHRRAGLPHAEALALREAGRRARGATLYVTLEPCAHTGKRTPPCVPTVLASGVRRVVVAMPDPNPRVRGRGIRRLRRAGLRVDVGCLRPEAEQLNAWYRHWIRTGRPYVLLKAAVTLDGKIATARGDSRWITGPEARRHAHRLRREVDAVLVGVGTVLHDDPRLTARDARGRAAPRQPIRVVLDGAARTPPRARVLAGAGTGAASGSGGTVILTSAQAPRARRARLASRGATVVVLPAEKGRVSLSAALRHLGRLGVTSVLIEGGAEVNASTLASGLADRLLLYVAPLVLGGRDATPLVGGRSPRRLSDAWRVADWRVRRLGRDLLVDGLLSARRSPPTSRTGS